MFLTVPMNVDWSIHKRNGHKGVILDTNLLVPFLVRSFCGHSKPIYARGHRTNEAYLPEVEEIVERFKGKVAVTSYIATEVCNLLKEKNLCTLREWLVSDEIDEHSVPAKILLRDHQLAFELIGLSDVSLIDASLNGYCVVTVDDECAARIYEAGGNVIALC